jgi:hypothetical protein
VNGGKWNDHVKTNICLLLGQRAALMAGNGGGDKSSWRVPYMIYEARSPRISLSLAASCGIQMNELIFRPTAAMENEKRLGIFVHDCRAPSLPSRDGLTSWRNLPLRQPNLSAESIFVAGRHIYKHPSCPSPPRP